MLQHAFAFERAIVTPHTFITVLMPVFLSAYLMGVLVQLPRTRFYRTALLPMVLWLGFRASMSLDLSGNHPGYAYINQVLVWSVSVILMRCTSWALARQPYSRMSICKPNENKTSDHKSDAFVASAMWNAFNLLFNLRGIGWNGPQWVPRIPTPSCPIESRPLFAFLSFCRAISLAVVCGIAWKCNRSLGRDTFGAAEGDTVFDLSLPPPQRYLKSSIVTVLTAFTGYLSMNTLYYLNAALFMILFRYHPSEWPPLFDSPFLSTSLHDFWGKRWHQFFYQVFVELGGIPLGRYFGKNGFIMGAFIVSGLLHEAGMRGMGRGAFTVPTMGFFLMQATGVIMERTWKRATGKHVGGFFGWLWASFWLILWGNLLADTYARSGLLGLESVI